MQIRLRDFQDPLLSFEHNLCMMGMHNPGRYCGFDTYTTTGALQFKVGHNGKGISLLNSDGDPMGPVGIAMSTQGMSIVETGEITGVTVPTNAGNPNPKVFYMVMTHQYQEIVGGLDAVYEVVDIPGNLQVPLVKITMLANASDLSTAKFEKMDCPDSGDGVDARLERVNNYRKTNQNAYDQFNYTAPEKVTASGNLWGFSNNGNTFKITPDALAVVDSIRIFDLVPQDGVEINLIINEFVKIRFQRPLIASEIDEGYGPLIFDSRLYAGKDTILGGDYGFIQPPAPSLWFLKFIRIDRLWYLISVEGLGYKTGGVSGGTIVRSLSPSTWNNVLVSSQASTPFGAGSSTQVNLGDGADHFLYPIFNNSPEGFTDNSADSVDYFDVVVSEDNRTKVKVKKACTVEVYFKVNYGTRGSTKGLFNFLRFDQVNAANGLKIDKWDGGQMIIGSPGIAFDQPSFEWNASRILNFQVEDEWTPGVYHSTNATPTANITYTFSNLSCIMTIKILKG